MDVRPGYKQTEIGPIPEDWDAVPLGDLFTFKNGLNKAKKYFGYGTPIVNYMDVFRHPGLRFDRIEGRVDVSKSELEAFEVRKGDVFFTRTSETVEEIGIAAAMLDPTKDTVFSGFVLRARPTDARLDERFKAYCFSPRYFRQQVIARATYTTRALTNGRSLSAAILAVPPVAEQQAIAEALSDIDSAISTMAGLIAKKRDIRTGAIQKLLTGQIRTEGFSEPWQEKRLGDHIRFQVGFPFRSVFFNKSGQGIRLVRNRDLKSNDELIYFNSDFDPGYIIKRGDLLVSMDGEFILHRWDGDDALLNQRVGRIVERGEVQNAFLSYYLVEPLREIEKATSSTTVKHLSHGDVEGIHIALPSLEEQQSIARVISDMDAEIAALETRLVKTRALKQGMMQALLTGRVRLPVRAEAMDALEVAHA
jgi:type I restriction enzyme S subunit